MSLASSAPARRLPAGARALGAWCALLLGSCQLGCAGAAPAGRGGDPLRGEGFELVPIAGGCFQMGADPDDCDATPEERPAHEVCVGGFSIGRYEVTRGQWMAVMGTEASAASTCTRDDCPVDEVSWDDAQAFLARLNGRAGAGRYRLPTEAEWEYAARSGGKAEKYSGGGQVDRFAWYGANSGRVNHPVGTRAPNGLGLYDMSGNVWELTSDWYDASAYASSPRNDPTGPATGQARVVRGGGRSDGAPSQRTTRRASVLDRTKGTGRGGHVGFRLALTP